MLTSTEGLHKENKELRLRIKALEEALQAETAKNDADRLHPLLDPQLLTIARPYLKDHPESISVPLTSSKSTTDSEEIVKLFGTMHVDDGKDKYLGVGVCMERYVNSYLTNQATALSETHLNVSVFLGPHAF